MRGVASRWMIVLGVLGALVTGSCAPSVPAPPITTAGTATPVSGTLLPAPQGTSSLAPSPIATPTPGAIPFRVAALQPAAVAGYLLPYWVGIEAGLFRQEGLAVQIGTIQSDQIALTAAANGEVDAVIGVPSPPLLAVLAGGIDAIIIGGTHNAFDQHLLAAADISTPADLVGKTAVIGPRHTLNEFQTREALQRLGLDPDRDLLGFWVGANQAERVENLRLGNGQATVLPPPLSVLVAREGFTDFGDLSAGPPWPGAAIIVTRRTYATRHDLVQRFLRGLLAGIQRTKADPALARQALTTYMKIDDVEALEETYSVYGDRLLERVPYLSLEGLQRAIEFGVQGRPVVGRLRPTALVDHTLLQRLESSGYINALYR
ncbi:MAG TPA: ABC transporter substrate-binding protein [Chloroflexota bacterium]|nr:ABC transporter substrate-binding protein [Chloroflexota bacterium]HZU07654.1 ABC transporter substrate-binding protein [Chloroflexota bacterium]